MKLTVDVEKIPLDSHDPIWVPDILEEYRLYDVDRLFHDKKYEPSQRLSHAEILLVYFTATICRLVICRETAGKWMWSSRNTYGNYTTFGNEESLKKVMTQMGAEIETGPYEYPEVEDLLAAFAKAIGVTNIAIMKHQKERA